MSSPRVGIFGAGPAGLSAALWLKNLGLDPLVIEVLEVGGGMQNLNFLANDWVLGQSHLTGPQLARRFVHHAQEATIKIIANARPVRVTGKAGAFCVRLERSSGESFDEAFSALLVATGTRFRGKETLAGIPGFDALPIDRLAFGPFAFQDMDGISDQAVLIIGGGDNAFENARLIAKSARVHLAMRSKPRAQSTLRQAVRVLETEGRCRLHEQTTVSAFGVVNEGIEVLLSDGARFQVGRIHVLAGYEPNTHFLRQAFEGVVFDVDREGYLRVDNAGRTNADGVYAAGDVCNPEFPSVVSAVSQGAHAAKTIEKDLRTP